MDSNAMKTNVTVLGWLYIVLGALGVVIGLFVFVLLLSIGAISGEREAAMILSVVGVITAGFTILLSAPGVVAGFGLLKFKSWSRILALVLGILNLPGFPLGTALGVYTLVVLLNEESRTLFE